MILLSDYIHVLEAFECCEPEFARQENCFYSSVHSASRSRKMRQRLRARIHAVVRPPWKKSKPMIWNRETAFCRDRIPESGALEQDSLSVVRDGISHREEGALCVTGAASLFRVHPKDANPE